MVFIECTPAPGDTYYYGCQRLDDRGWGCVYRCAQTTMATMGYAVHERAMPGIPDMMTTLGVPLQAARVRDLWIEPKQVRDLLLEYCGPKRDSTHHTSERLTWSPRLIGLGIKSDHLLRTSMDDFDTLYQRWLPFHIEVVRHLRERNSPVVIDDGTTGLCITGLRGPLGSPGGTYLVVDPHVTAPGTQFREIPVVEFYARTPMQMALVS